MKISTELQDFRNRSINFEEISARNEISSAKEKLNRQLIESVITRIHADKRIIDALTTSHIAQSLIHKAMEVAARLSRAAHQSVIEAGSGFEEIEAAVNSSSELESLGKSLDTLSSTDTPALPENMPSVLPELESLNNIAVSASGSGSFNTSALEQVSASLMEKSDAINRFIVNLGLPVADTSDFSRERVTDISASILSAPETALAAQANLTNEQVSQKI